MQKLDPRTVANRENARKSTGPKTEAGKVRSRANAFRHGLAGAGVVWPGEDPKEMEAFVAEQVALERPQDGREAWLARRAAVLAWQVDRGEELEAVNATIRSAEGEGAELERRAAEVERLVKLLADDPARGARSLLRTAEGCAWILTALREFMEAAEADWWLCSYDVRLDALCNPPQPGLFRISRAKALALALGSRTFEAVWPNGVPGLEDAPGDDAPAQERAAWHRRRDEIVLECRPRWQAELGEILRRRIAEVEALLASHRQRPDPAMELAHLAASFDHSPEGERLRRYQRANLRQREKTLRELDAWRAGRDERTSRPAAEDVAPPDPESDPESESDPDPESEPGSQPEAAPSPAAADAENAQAHDRVQAVDMSKLGVKWLRSVKGPYAATEDGREVPVTGRAGQGNEEWVRRDR